MFRSNNTNIASGVWLEVGSLNLDRKSLKTKYMTQRFEKKKASSKLDKDFSKRRPAEYKERRRKLPLDRDLFWTTKAKPVYRTKVHML